MGGRNGFDGNIEAGVAGRCRQLNVKKVALRINANEDYAFAA